MRSMHKVFVLSFIFSSLMVSSAAAQNAGQRVIIRQQTTHRIQDHMFSSHNVNDQRDLVRRLHDKMKSFRENAGKQINNLLPMQGKARLVVLNAREQAGRMKAQQKARNRILQDRLSDLKQRNNALSKNRSDLQLRSRLDR